MRTLLDNQTGSTVFIPESDADTRLLYHLMNCADLTQFSEYLSLETKYDNRPVTSDLGVPVDLLDDYPELDLRRISPVNKYPNLVSKSKELRPITTPPEYETLPFAELTDKTEKRLIGFDRDSAHDGYRFKIDNM